MPPNWVIINHIYEVHTQIKGSRGRWRPAAGHLIQEEIAFRLLTLGCPDTIYGHPDSGEASFPGVF
jgi:hypothetical protein